MIEIQGLPLHKWLRHKWRANLFRLKWKWREILVQLGLRKAPPKADPRSRIVNALDWIFDPPSISPRDLN